MQKQFILYGTSACHLCDDAEVSIRAISKTMPVIYIKQDIIEDDILLEKYGSSIPIFHCKETKNELSWPFNELALKEFINGQ
jgi:hypothetical protein